MWAQPCPAPAHSHVHGTTITVINTSLPTQCDNYCLVLQLTPLLRLCAFPYFGQEEGLKYQILYFLKEPINTWNSDPSFFDPTCGGNRSGQGSIILSHPRKTAASGNLSQIPTGQLGNTLCVCQAKRGSSKQRTSLRSVTNIPTAYL